MRFIADAMLGRLARWLRLLGFDTLYISHIPDGVLVRTAREQGRFILTRDTELSRRGMGDCLLVRSDHPAEQLEQIIRELGLEPLARPRCASCNGSLEDVTDRETVREDVPEHVYHTAERFHRCSHCSRIYWEGSHHSDFSGRLRDIMRLAQEPRHA